MGLYRGLWKENRSVNDGDSKVLIVSSRLVAAIEGIWYSTRKICKSLIKDQWILEEKINIPSPCSTRRWKVLKAIDHPGLRVCEFINSRASQWRNRFFTQVVESCIHFMRVLQMVIKCFPLLWITKLMAIFNIW